ncbi:MAG: hypothetical protein C0480_02885 [Bradyrhizobium sp.]|nr:hypothetical protein [Bradyrhizobium sp.]
MTTRTTFGDQTETAHSLTFTLHLAGKDAFKLDTGEVFQAPARAAARKDKPPEISAYMNVRPATDGRDPSHINKMTYHAAVTGDDYGSPPSIHFDASMLASDYSLLLNNIRGGVLPSSVTVGLRHDIYDKASPIDYGHGSLMVWRNAMEQNQRVDVESVEFYYQLLGTGYNDDENTKPPTAKASIDAASAAIVSKLADLEKTFVKGNGLIVTAIIIACAVLYFARH